MSDFKSPTLAGVYGRLSSMRYSTWVDFSGLGGIADLQRGQNQTNANVATLTQSLATAMVFIDEQQATIKELRADILRIKQREGIS